MSQCQSRNNVFVLNSNSMRMQLFYVGLLAIFFDCSECWCELNRDLSRLKQLELVESLRWEREPPAQMEGSHNESIKSVWLFEMALKIFKCLTLVRHKRLKYSGVFFFFYFTLIRFCWIDSHLLFFFPVSLKLIYMVTFSEMVVMWRCWCRREVLAYTCQCRPWPKFITAH